MTNINCAVSPAMCINLYFTHGCDSVGVSFNLISRQWKQSVWVFGVETGLVFCNTLHLTFFSVVVVLLLLLPLYWIRVTY